MHLSCQRALSFSFLVFSAAAAWADTTATWRTGVTGNYATGSNWVGSLAPTAADTASIQSGTAILFDVRPAAAKNLFLNGTLNLAGFSMGVGSLSGLSGVVVNSGTALSTLSVNGPSSSTFSGRLLDASGVLALKKAGAGVLTLSGNNTYSGGTILSGGGLKLTSAQSLGRGALTIAGVSTLDNGFLGDLLLTTNNAQFWNANFTFLGSNRLNMGTGSVVMNGSRTVTVAGQILTIGGGVSGGSAGLTKAGQGELVLAGLNSYQGTTTISAGTLRLGDGGTNIGLGRGAIVDNGNFALDFTDSLYLGNTISGRGGFTKYGYGVLALAGNNSYSGGTILNRGTIQLGSANALGAASGDLEINGGMLDLAGQSIRVGLLSGIWGNIGNYSTSQTVKIISNSSKSGVLGTVLEDGIGQLSWEKAGSGTISIANQLNSYSGGTILSAGGLNIEGSHAMGTGAITVAGAITLDVVGGPGQILETNNAQFWNSNFTYKGTYDLNLGTGNVALNATHTVNVLSSTLTVGGAISGSTTSTGLTKTGTGTLLLAGDNTYAGATTIKAGLLQLGNGGTTGRLGAGAITIANAATFTVNRSGDLALVNTIGGAGKFIKNGGGTVTLSGANSYSGGTVLNEGTLNLGNAKALGAATGNLTVNGGQLNLFNHNITVGLLSGTGGIITVASGFYTGHVLDNPPVFDPTLPRTLTTRSSLSGTFAGSLTDGGTSPVISAYWENVVVSGTSLAIYDLHGLEDWQPVTVVSGTLHTTQGDYSGSATYIYSAPTGQLIRTGDSVATMAVNGPKDTTWSFNTGNNTPSQVINFPLPRFAPGLLVLNKEGSGTLTLSGSSSYSGGTILREGGLNLANAHAIGTGRLTIAGASTLDNTSGAELTLATNNAQAWNANFTFKGSQALDLGTGDVALNATHTVTVASSTLTVGGVISGSTATTGLTKSGTGTLVLTGHNTYTGLTTINQGSLQLGNGGATGSLAGGIINNFGVLAFNRSGTISYGGVIAGSGSVRQNGSGTLKLAGANTYTGGTEVKAGRLQVGSAKALGTGRVTLDAGSVLATDGVQHQINIGSNLVWDTDARIALTLTSDPLTTESVKVATTLSSFDGGPFTFIFNDPSLVPDFKVAVMTVGRNGFAGLTAGGFLFESNDADLHGQFVIEGTTLYFQDASLAMASVDGGVFTLSSSYDGFSYSSASFESASWFTVVAVPEPSTYALLALALAVLPFLRRLRRAGLN